jgi:hypothetical protein
MADLWLEIDERYKAGHPIDDLLAQITYSLRLGRHWPRVDCVDMSPGLAVSGQGRAALIALGVPGMQFLRFRINSESFYLFYTDRRLDCLDRQRSELLYFQSDPKQVMEVQRYVFKEERVQPCDVFTVPERSDGIFFWCQETFVTDAVRATLEKAGLTGFRFAVLPGLEPEVFPGT